MSFLTSLLLVSTCILVEAYASPKSVTYPHIGTFRIDDFYDAKNRPMADLFLPQSPRLIEPTFLLYTRQNSRHPEKLQWNSTESIERSKYFDKSVNTKIIVHGFIDEPVIAKWMFEMKNNFLHSDAFNVVILDWTNGNRMPYGQATVNARVVGAMIAIQMQRLCEIHGVGLESFHILGHSLGAHVAAYAGKFLNGSLGQITGLDPAGPNFEFIRPEARLWHTDAKFVDVIHTDSSNLGMFEPCGHVDFYPNGGKSQPGCVEEKLTAFIGTSLTDGFRTLLACDHQRAVDFYVEAILSRGTPLAFACPDYGSFRSGQCSECGENKQKCCFLGPRATECAEKESNTAEYRNRFFIDTAAHKPYFS